MMRGSSLSAAMMVAGIALCARPAIAVEGMTEEERKTPPAPQPAPDKPTNLPGETNRQFAARMKAEGNQ